MLGASVVGAVLYDVFQSVVVPRWTDRTLRLAPFITDRLWSRWRATSFKLKTSTRREDFLGTFAPLALVVILFAWVVSLVLGYGLMLHALRSETSAPDGGFGTFLYVAAGGLFTVGFGEVVAMEPLARIVLTSSAAAGLAVVALVISLTFTLYGSFQRREVLILTLDARAGSPPSGVTLLETYARFDLLDELPALFGSWELWAAEMLESHLAYPLLPYFRSSHDNESWVSAMGAILDAATLMVTTVAACPERSEGSAARISRPQGAAHLMYKLGCHAIIDLSHWFRFDLNTKAADGAEADAGVEPLEFELARRRLEKAGYTLLPFEQSWHDFRARRAVYAASINALAKHFATPPTQWIGDRSTVTHLHHRKSD